MAARRKKPPALLELIRQDRRRGYGSTLGLPTWWNKSASKPPAGEEAAQADQATDIDDRPAEPDVGRRALAWRDGILSINLDPVTAVLAVALLLILLLGAYWLGLGAGGPEAQPQTTSTAESDAVIDLFLPPQKPVETPAQDSAGRLQQGAARPEPPGRATKPQAQPEPPPIRVPSRQGGLTYLVLQEFPANARDQAQRAQAFLAEHGMPTTIEPMQRGRWRIVTLEGADSRSAQGRTKLSALAEQARQIGQAYVKAGGRYRFHDPYWWTIPKGRASP